LLSWYANFRTSTLSFEEHERFMWCSSYCSLHLDGSSGSERCSGGSWCSEALANNANLPLHWNNNWQSPNSSYPKSILNLRTQNFWFCIVVCILRRSFQIVYERFLPHPTGISLLVFSSCAWKNSKALLCQFIKQTR
jgi:hypothetical protein